MARECYDHHAIASGKKQAHECSAFDKEKGLTQKDIAEALQLTQSAVSKLLSGQRRLTVDRALTLARLLDFSVEELIEFLQDTTPAASN